MSKLGDILKELFPIHGMSEQILGPTRTSQLEKFGKEIANEIKKLAATGFGATVSAGKAAPNTIVDLTKKLDQWLQGKGMTGLNPATYFKNLTQALIHAVPAFGALAKQLLVTTVKGIPLVGGALAGAGRVIGGVGRAVGQTAVGLAAAPFQAIGSLLRGFAHLTGTVGNVVLRFAELRLLLGSFSFDISEANRNLAEWNGQIAASFQKLDVTKMRLAIQTGAATSGTASELNNQIGKLLQEFQPVREEAGKAINMLGIVVTRTMTSVLQSVKTIAAEIPWLKKGVDALDAIEEDLKKNNNQIPMGNQLLHGLIGLNRAGLNRLPDNIKQDNQKARDAFIQRPPLINIPLPK